MATAKRPADRKPKARKASAAKRIAAEANGNGYHLGPPFTFTVDGRTYTLPPATAAGRIEAGLLIDALEGDDQFTEVRLGLAGLKAANVDPETMAALRSLPIEDFGPLLAAWLRQGGVEAGES